MSSTGKRNDRPADRDEKIRKLHAAGLPTETISLRLGLSLTTIKDALSRLGLSRPANKWQR